MKIKKIEIENFGRFHKYSLDLSPGINLVYGNNEDGKTTLMAFIKMMFYGEQKRARDISNNPRKKYMPWNGQLMGGAIEFESEGIEYRIEKEMGSTPAKDKVKVINLQTGEALLQQKEELGKVFFGTDLPGFERSIFIGQVGAFGADKEDEIAQKLSNMFSTGEDNISQSQVEDRIGKAKEEMKSIRGNKGLLVDVKEALGKLKEEKAQIRELEEMQGEFLEELKSKKEQILEKKKQKKKLESSIKVSELENVQQKLQLLVQKAEEEISLKEKIQEGEVELEQFSSFVSECKMLLGNLQSQETAMERFRENSQIQQKNISEIKEEEYQQYQELEESLQKAERYCEYFEKNLLPALFDFNRTRDQLLDQIISKKVTKDRIVFWGGMACSLLLLLAGIMRYPIGLILGVSFGLLTLFIYLHNKKQRKIDKQNTDILKDEPMIQKLEQGLQNQIAYFKEQFSIEYNLSKDAQKFMDRLERNKMELEGKLVLLLEQKDCKTKEEFKTFYLDSISSQNDKKTLDVMKIQYLKECNKLIEQVSRYQKVDSLEMAIGKLEQMEHLFVMYSSKQQEVKHMASALDIPSVNLEAFTKEVEKISEQIMQLGHFSEEELLNSSSEFSANLQNLEAEIERLEEELSRLREKIRTPEKNLSQIEVEQKELEERAEELQFYYDSLTTAGIVLKEAGEEVRQSFGPELNQKTGEIFNQLTGGSYKQVIVAKDYSLLAQAADDIHYREASYLSNGTVDQAYLAIRLAITQLIMKDTENLPLFLDDIFMQYDDNRVREGFTFLRDFFRVDEKQSQVIMFTCHSYIRDIALEKLGDSVTITTL